MEGLAAARMVAEAAKAARLVAVPKGVRREAEARVVSTGAWQGVKRAVETRAVSMGAGPAAPGALRATEAVHRS